MQTHWLLSFLLACCNCCCPKSDCGGPSSNSVGHFFYTFLKDSWLSLETLNPSPSTILLNRIAIRAASFTHFVRLSCKFLHDIFDSQANKILWARCYWAMGTFFWAIFWSWFRIWKPFFSIRSSFGNTE